MEQMNQALFHSISNTARGTRRVTSERYLLAAG
jgi:hypothetical protein